jgi:hypothetical protein
LADAILWMQQRLVKDDALSILVHVLFLRVLAARLAPFLRQLLVVPPQQAEEDEAEHGPAQCDPKTRSERCRVEWRFRLNENISRDEIRAVPHSEDDRSACGDAWSPTKVV